MTDSPRMSSVLENFTRNAGHFNRVGPPIYSIFAERLIALLDPPVGARVLDVCCGTGAVTLPVARKVGAAGHVVGVDLTPAMLERAVAEAAQSHVNNAEFREADAMQLDFPSASFDVVTSGFGIQFFPDPVAAMAHWSTFLKPGGRFGCSTWSESGFEPLMTVARALLAEEGVTQDSHHGRPTSNPSNLTDYAREAGLVGVECQHDHSEILFANPADAVLGTPRGRNVLNVLPAERRDVVRAELIRRLEAIGESNGLTLRIGVLYLTARNGN